MPKIFGLNLVGVLAASFAFYVVGFLWYGLLFTDPWMAAHNLNQADAQSQSPIWMGLGFLITFMQVIGIGKVLQWKGVSSLGDAVMTTLVLWFFLGFAYSLYAFIYVPSHNVSLMLVDSSHLLVGWIVSAILLSVLK